MKKNLIAEIFPNNEKQLFQLFQQVQSDCRKAGIPIRAVSNLSVNPRLTRAQGRCEIQRREKKTIFTIQISQGLLDTHHLQALKDVLAHELIHTVEGCNNHSKLFHYYGQRLKNYNSDYTISTTFRFQDYGLNSAQFDQTRPYKYILECTQCEARYFRKNLSNTVRYPSRYRCSHCGGSIKRVF